MILKPVLLKIFEAANMQRWNDQIRAVDMFEIDKQAHKMILAYVLAKCEEDEGNRDLDWIKIIEAGFFEYLQIIVLTDLKPPLFYEIKKDKEKYYKLNMWVYEKILPVISNLGTEFCERFRDYILKSYEDINSRIIGAAHFYITKWEFNIISKYNPGGYLLDEIKRSITDEQSRYESLKCMKRFQGSDDLKIFIDICGQLRFQIRWSHLYRIPRTSVLGHMLIVSYFSYIFSLIARLKKQNCINNFLTGLFHDLPEVLTRDVINPVKKSVQGLDDLIKDYEKKEMDNKIYKLIPESWHGQMRNFTQDEFSNTPERNGELVKGADDMSAFIEAYLSLKNGIQNQNLQYAKKNLREKYSSRVICGMDFKKLYDEFE